MRGIAIGVQEADGDRLDAVGDQALRHRAHFGGVERRQHVAVAVHALRHLQPMAARHQRVGEAQEQVVDVVALLGAHLEDVAEAARGDQAEPRAAALDQGVGDQRRAVHHVADVGKREPSRLQQFGEPLERADRWVVRRGQALVQADVVALRVEQDEVGEGAADVEADAVAGGSGHAVHPCVAAAGLCAAAMGASSGRTSVCKAIARYHIAQFARRRLRAAGLFDAERAEGTKGLRASLPQSSPYDNSPTPGRICLTSPQLSRSTLRSWVVEDGRVGAVEG